jgi:hypothetical protein
MAISRFNRSPLGSFFRSPLGVRGRNARRNILVCMGRLDFVYAFGRTRNFWDLIGGEWVNPSPEEFDPPSFDNILYYASQSYTDHLVSQGVSGGLYRPSLDDMYAPWFQFATFSPQQPEMTELNTGGYLPVITKWKPAVRQFAWVQWDTLEQHPSLRYITGVAGKGNAFKGTGISSTSQYHPSLPWGRWEPRPNAEPISVNYRFRRRSKWTDAALWMAGKIGYAGVYFSEELVHQDVEPRLRHAMNEVEDFDGEPLLVFLVVDSAHDCDIDAIPDLLNEPSLPSRARVLLCLTSDFNNSENIDSCESYLMSIADQHERIQYLGHFNSQVLFAENDLEMNALDDATRGFLGIGARTYSWQDIGSVERAALKAKAPTLKRINI